MRRLALLTLLVPALSAASSGIDAQKAVEPPKIDGTISEAEWGAAHGEGFFDTRNGAAAEPGRFWLTYDEKYIYFAAQLDGDPKSIKATEYRQNVRIASDDSVFLVVEPFGNANQANVFGVNARGATDVRIAGGRAIKREWLGEFMASGRVTEKGFEIEARIPWGIMRLPAPGKRDVRFNVVRYNPTSQREMEWHYTNNQSSNSPFWRGVEVPASGNERTLKLLPYVYGGWSRNGHIANGGLDLKTSLTDQIDLVGTVNPDFHNVENQVLSVDFSYFERLAGEARPFFLEGTNFFGTSQDAPLFASQRIGKFDAGLKSFGQITDRTRFAILDTIDLGEQNAFAGNVRHQFSDNTGATVALSSLADRRGADNTAIHLGFDSTFKSGLGVFGQHQTSRDTVSGYGHRINTGLFYNANGIDAYAEYLEVTRGYNPRLGFIRERDVKGFATGGEYVKPVERGPVMEYGFGVNASDFRRMDGRPHRRGLEFNTSLTLRDGTDIDTGASFERFRGNDDRLWFVSLERPRGDAYRRWQVDYVSGVIAGRAYDSFGLQTSYRPVSPLQLSLRAQEVRHFTRSTQLIFGANYDLGNDMSVSGRMVRNGRDTNAYVAFRKSGNRGAEYYVIFGDPNARKFETSIVIKAVFPFELKL
jgi:hypothetical protein